MSSLSYVRRGQSRWKALPLTTPQLMARRLDPSNVKQYPIICGGMLRAARCSSQLRSNRCDPEADIPRLRENSRISSNVVLASKGSELKRLRYHALCVLHGRRLHLDPHPLRIVREFDIGSIMRRLRWYWLGCHVYVVDRLRNLR